MKIEFFKTGQDFKNSSSKSSGDTERSSCVLCSVYLDNILSMKENRNLGSTDFNNDKSFLRCNLNQFEEDSLKELSAITPLETLNEIFINLIKEMVRFKCFCCFFNFTLNPSILLSAIFLKTCYS